MTTKSNRHAVEIVRDETWPPNYDVAAYTWQCEPCGDRSEPFYATDLYGDGIGTGDADRRARSLAEIDSLDHTEPLVELVDDEIERGADEWELSL